MEGGEIFHFPATPGEVFRRDRVTVDEGEHKCVGETSGPTPTPATCTATATVQETVGGNFDYNWDAVDTNTFFDPRDGSPPVLKTTSFSRFTVSTFCRVLVICSNQLYNVMLMSSTS